MAPALAALDAKWLREADPDGLLDPAERAGRAEAPNSQDGRTLGIAGSTSVEQLKKDAAAADWMLTTADIAELDQWMRPESLRVFSHRGFRAPSGPRKRASRVPISLRRRRQCRNLIKLGSAQANVDRCQIRLELAHIDGAR